MYALHIVLLAAAAVLLAATSAGAGNLRRREQELPLIGYIISGALLVGNAACLLPSAPQWYRVAMVAVSVAGLAWFFVSVASAGRRSDDAVRASADIYAGRVPTRPVPARPALRLVHSADTVAGSAQQPAPAPRTRMSHPSTIDERPVATQATFDATTAATRRGATGPTYVAAHITDYVDTSRTRRAHGRHVARTHTHMDPTERFLRLADAYSIDRGPRSLGRSSLA